MPAAGVGLYHGCITGVPESTHYHCPHRTLNPVAGTVFAGMSQLFEVYLLHVVGAFGDGALSQLINPNAAARATESMTPRLKTTLVRVVGRWVDHTPVAHW